MKPARIVRALALLAFGALATSLPEKIGRADTDGGVDGSTGSAREGDASHLDAVAGHYQPGRGSVVDTRTRLTWQLDVPKDPLPWSQARDYCAALDLDGPGWRLPSVSELQTLIDETAFPGTPSDYFWTSSILPRFESFAWTVYFGYGLSTFFDVNQTHLVRCVR